MEAFILGVVVAMLINLVTALFSRRHGLQLIPWLCLYIAIHGTYVMLASTSVMAQAVKVSNKYPPVFTYPIVVTLAAILAGLFWHSVNVGVHKLAQVTAPQTANVGDKHVPIVQPNPYPALDFLLIPEHIHGNVAVRHIPHLELSIRNRGNYAIKDMRMRPTMYQLDLRFKVLPRVEKLPENKVRIYPGKTEPVIKNFVRIGKDSVKIRSIAPGTKSKPVEISTLKEFKFVKPPSPGEPGGLGGPPLQGVPVGESDTFRYYALRYSFIDDATQKRYSFYQVISCHEPYLLPLDNPNISIIGAGTESDDDWLLRPSQLIIDHQRKIYGSYLEEEYRPSDSAMPQ